LRMFQPRTCLISSLQVRIIWSPALIWWTPNPRATRIKTPAICLTSPSTTLEDILNLRLTTPRCKTPCLTSTWTITQIITEGKVQAAIHQITDDSSRRSSTECLLRKKITGSVALKNTIENSCLRNTTENLHQRSSTGDLPPWLQVMDGMIKDISGCLHFIKNNCHLHCWSCCHFLVKNQLLCRFLAIKTLL